MNLLHKCLRSTKIFALTLSFVSLLIFCFPTAAKADTVRFLQPIAKCVPIKNGNFTVKSEGIIPSPITIRSAVVTATPTVQGGKLEFIKIYQPRLKPEKDDIEFGTENINFSNGIDLIKAAGGPAVLKAGTTIYEAQGSGFAPDADIKFCVDLRDDFLP